MKSHNSCSKKCKIEIPNTKIPKKNKIKQLTNSSSYTTVYQGKPRDLVAENITSNSATIRFVAIGQPLCYDLLLTSNNQTTTYKIYSNEFNLSNLSPGYTYEVIIIAYYKSNDSFTIVNPIVFTTLNTSNVFNLQAYYYTNQTIYENNINVNQTPFNIQFDSARGNPQYLVYIDNSLNAVLTSTHAILYAENDVSHDILVKVQYDNTIAYESSTILQPLNESNSIITLTEFNIFGTYVDISFNKALGNPSYKIYLLEQNNLVSTYETSTYVDSTISFDSLNQNTNYNIYVETSYNATNNSYISNNIFFTTNTETSISNIYYIATIDSLYFSFQPPAGSFLSNTNSIHKVSIKSDIYNSGDISLNNTQIDVSFTDLSQNTLYELTIDSYYDKYRESYYRYTNNFMTNYEGIVQDISIFDISFSSAKVTFIPYQLPNDPEISKPDYFSIHLNNQIFYTYENLYYFANLTPESSYNVMISSHYNTGNIYNSDVNYFITTKEPIIIDPFAADDVSQNEGPVKDIILSELRGNLIGLNWNFYEETSLPDYLYIDIFDIESDICENRVELVASDLSAGLIDKTLLFDSGVSDDDIVLVYSELDKPNNKYRCMITSKYENRNYKRFSFFSSLNEFNYNINTIVTGETSIQIYSDTSQNNQDFNYITNLNSTTLIWNLQDISYSNTQKPFLERKKYNIVTMSKTGQYIFIVNSFSVEIFYFDDIFTLYNILELGDQPTFLTSSEDGKKLYIGYNTNFIDTYDIDKNELIRLYVGGNLRSRNIFTNAIGSIIAITDDGLYNDILIYDVLQDLSFNISVKEHYESYINNSSYKQILNKHVSISSGANPIIIVSSEFIDDNLRISKCELYRKNEISSVYINDIYYELQDVFPTTLRKIPRITPQKIAKVIFQQNFSETLEQGTLNGSYRRNYGTFGRDPTYIDYTVTKTTVSYENNNWFTNFADVYTSSDSSGTVYTIHEYTHNVAEGLTDAFKCGDYTWKTDSITYNRNSPVVISFLPIYESTWWLRYTSPTSKCFIEVSFPYDFKITNSQLFGRGKKTSARDRITENSPTAYKIFGVDDSDNKFLLLYVNNVEYIVDQYYFYYPTTVNINNNTFTEEIPKVINTNNFYRKIRIELVNNYQKKIFLDYWKIGGFAKLNESGNEFYYEIDESFDSSGNITALTPNGNRLIVCNRSNINIYDITDEGSDLIETIANISVDIPRIIPQQRVSISDEGNNFVLSHYNYQESNGNTEGQLSYYFYEDNIWKTQLIDNPYPINSNIDITLKGSWFGFYAEIDKSGKIILVGTRPKINKLDNEKTGNIYIFNGQLTTSTQITENEITISNLEQDTSYNFEISSKYNTDLDYSYFNYIDNIKTNEENSDRKTDVILNVYSNKLDISWNIVGDESGFEIYYTIIIIDNNTNSEFLNQRYEYYTDNVSITSLNTNTTYQIYFFSNYKNNETSIVNKYENLNTLVKTLNENPPIINVVLDTSNLVVLNILSTYENVTNFTLKITHQTTDISYNFTLEDHNDILFDVSFVNLGEQYNAEVAIEYNNSVVDDKISFTSQKYISNISFIVGNTDSKPYTYIKNGTFFSDYESYFSNFSIGRPPSSIERGIYETKPLNWELSENTLIVTNPQETSTSVSTLKFLDNLNVSFHAVVHDNLSNISSASKLVQSLTNIVYPNYYTIQFYTANHNSSDNYYNTQEGTFFEENLIYQIKLYNNREIIYQSNYITNNSIEWNYNEIKLEISKSYHNVFFSIEKVNRFNNLFLSDINVTSQNEPFSSNPFWIDSSNNTSWSILTNNSKKWKDIWLYSENQYPTRLLSTNMSLSFWFYVHSLSSTENILFYLKSDTKDIIKISCDTQNIYVENSFYDDPNNNKVAITYAKNISNQIFITLYNTNLCIYLNSLKEYDSNFNNFLQEATQTDTLYFGSPETTNDLGTIIKSTRLYNHILNSNEIYTVYENEYNLDKYNSIGNVFDLTSNEINFENINETDYSTTTQDVSMNFNSNTILKKKITIIDSLFIQLG